MGVEHIRSIPATPRRDPPLPRNRRNLENRDTDWGIQWGKREKQKACVAPLPGVLADIRILPWARL